MNGNYKLGYILVLGLILNLNAIEPGQETVIKKLRFECHDSNNILKRAFYVNLEEHENNTFIENGILCSDSSYKCSLKYRKLNNQNFEIWDGNQWKLFLDSGFKSYNVFLFDKNKTLNFSTTYTYFNDTLYAFSCKNESFNYNGDDNLYLFSVNLGFVIIKNTSTYYKRNDYFSRKWGELKSL